jgi:hypothetical protein
MDWLLEYITIGIFNFTYRFILKLFFFGKLDTWIETLEKNGVKDDESEVDEDGILKTLANISRCLKRPLSDIQLEWTFMNITITSNWTSKQDIHKGENLKLVFVKWSTLD